MEATNKKNRLNTAEAVDNVITMITNDLQKNSIIGLCRKGLSLNKDYILFLNLRKCTYKNNAKQTLLKLLEK